MGVEQLARNEFKYAVRPDQLDDLRRSLRAFCVPDGFYLPEKNGWYTVDTLYLESPDLRVYASCENQHLVRSKLRIRTYPDAPNAVAKIEVKRRIHELIMKTGVVVPGEGWAGWIDGARPAASLPEGDRASLQQFLTMQRTQNLGPYLLIRYQRQAWRSIYEDYVRLTFDRQMECQPMDRYDLNADPRRWTAVDNEGSLSSPGALLMELKFKQRPPIWMADMVRRFGLQRQGFSKYCSGVRRIRQERHYLLDRVPLSAKGAFAWIS